MNRHALLVKLGLDTTPKIATQLLNSYASTRYPFSLTFAQRLFDQVPNKDTVLWSSLISAYARSNLPIKALQLFALYNQESDCTHKANPFIYATTAHAISSLSEPYIYLGRSLHAQVVKHGVLWSNVVVGTAFLDMYTKCGVVGCAWKVFDEMPERNLVTWNAMVAGYVRNGMVFDGLDLFYGMKCCELLMPDEFTASTVLIACGNVQDLTLGMQLHAFTIITGLFADCVNFLCNMYFLCGKIIYAERVVEGIDPGFNLSLIRVRGYIMNNCYKKGLDCFVFHHNNVAELFEADHTILVPLLTACARLSLLKFGKQVHCLLVTLDKFSKSCLSQEDVVIIGCALIDMYSKCYSVSVARKVFDNWGFPQQVPHWNAMINGYVYNGLIQEARTLFEVMPEKNVVSFTSLMTGYVQSDMPKEGLELLARMHSAANMIMGNSYTFVVGLEACTQLIDLNRGKQIHAKIIRRLTSLDFQNPIICTKLIDMYSKTASVRYAQFVFDSMVEQNVFAWTSIITSYALHGDSSHALELFGQMIDDGVEPNEVTFVSVLSACSHCGLVEEGLGYFKMMSEKYGLVPREDHFTCLIDMLGRIGRLGEAWEILEEVERGEMYQSVSTQSILAAMAGACQLHGDINLGRRITEKLLKQKEEPSSTHIALSNVYASAGLWQEAHQVRETGKKGGAMPEKISSENLLNNIMESLGDLQRQASGSSIDNISDSVTTGFNRLFGRQKPLHHIFGGGKSADVLLWRNKKISASVVSGATVIWVLFEWLNYHLLTILCLLVVLGMVGQFGWSNVSEFLSRTRSPSQFPRIELPEQLFVNLAVSDGAEINKALGYLQDVACSGNLKQFFLALLRHTHFLCYMRGMKTRLKTS